VLGFGDGKEVQESLVKLECQSLSHWKWVVKDGLGDSFAGASGLPPMETAGWVLVWAWMIVGGGRNNSMLKDTPFKLSISRVTILWGLWTKPALVRIHIFFVRTLWHFWTKIVSLVSVVAFSCKHTYLALSEARDGCYWKKIYWAISQWHCWFVLLSLASTKPTRPTYDGSV
jgi:hypothetical protein